MANVNLHRVTNFSLYLLFTAYYLTQKLVDSCHFYTGIRFVLSCFYLLFFYFDQVESEHLPFAVSMTLNLSNIIIIILLLIKIIKLKKEVNII